MFKSQKSLSDEKIPLLNSSKEFLYNVAETVAHKYPTAVIFVLITKLFEAFAANGIRTILVLYLRDDLNFSESFATIMLHVFNFFGQFTPIFGAILADTYIGNVKTISWFCVVYALGWYGLILTSFPNIAIPLIFLVSLSLFLIAIGNGSIRACITSLGATQFKVPQQNELLSDYFSHYYFVYYLGIFLSKILPPMVRAKTSCYGKEGCYPAVFGTLGSAFLASWIFFIIGKIYYKDEVVSNDNILLRFFGCIKHAIFMKIKNSHIRTKNWLQHAIGKYSTDFVKDVSTVLKVVKLFIPLPIYFALLAQQDSSWTFQASQMNTTIAGIKIEPDQAKAMGPIFLFTMIPIWKLVVVPILKNCNIELSPLTSMIIGGICSAFSFICSGLLQLQINSNPMNSINIAWQSPQFILLMMGELFLSIPGLQFAFTQAPLSMKSVLTAAFFLNNAFGNLIVVIFTEANLIKSQSLQYFFYAVLMFLSIGLFIILACEYTKELNATIWDEYDEPQEINKLTLSNRSSRSSLIEFVL